MGGVAIRGEGSLALNSGKILGIKGLV